MASVRKVAARARPVQINAPARSWAPVLVYAAVALWLVHDGLGDRVLGLGIDLVGTLWFHDWIADSIVNLHSPGFTDRFFWPDGVDFFPRTGNNFLDAAVAAPLYLLLGMPRHYAPFIGLLLLGNGLAAHRLCRGLGLSLPASIAGGLALQVHPYPLHEIAQGRPTQALLWFLPLALHHLLAMRTDPRWRHPLLGGILVGVQGWTYWFDAHFFLLACGPLLLVALARERTPAYAVRLVVAGAVAIATVLPGVVPMAIQASAGSVPFLDQAMFAERLVDVNIARRSGSWWLLAPGSSPAPPITLPLLALMALGLAWSRDRMLWGTGLAAGLLVVAGPVMALPGGDRLNPLWQVADAVVPFLERLWFPYRGWSVLAVLTAPVLAEAIDRVGPRLGRRRVAAAWAMAATVLVVVVSPTPRLGVRLIGEPMARPAYVDVVREAPGVVLDLPWLCTDTVIHHQVWHRQPLLAGMAVSVDAYRPPGVTQRVQGDPLLDAITRLSLGDIRADDALEQAAELLGEPHAARWVVVHPHLYEETADRPRCWSGIHLPRSRRAQWLRGRLAAALGSPAAEDDQAMAWDLQRTAKRP